VLIQNNLRATKNRHQAVLCNVVSLNANLLLDFSMLLPFKFQRHLDDTVFEFKLRTDNFFNQVWLTLEILLDFR